VGNDPRSPAGSRRDPPSLGSLTPGGVVRATLDDRMRSAVGPAVVQERESAFLFASAYARLLARALPDEVSPEGRAALEAALNKHTELDANEVRILVDLALLPASRAVVNERDLRAFGSRFGAVEEDILRARVGEELDLAGFAERYGAAEGLLLLDSLFGLCAVDGVIDQNEISRLQGYANELGIDPMLVGALFRKHDARHAKGEFKFNLDGDRNVVGRGNLATVQLPDPQVAHRHCEIVRDGPGWRVVDLASGRPTLLNGTPITTAPFRPGDQLRVGPYTLTLDPEGREIAAAGVSSFSALSVRNLKRRIGRVSLLDDVSFTVFSGEVIAVVGPSGGGKTTLLSAIAGIAPADTGDVLLDNSDFHALLANDRSLVGIVPQDDVVHAELTVEESLYYSGRLRFPRSTPNAAIRKEVDRVLDELSIAHIRKSRIGDALRRGVSGGQKKRVSLGQELLTRSTKVLFLDEPTSGLDPQTAQDIVKLVRQLADDGRIIFIVTHDVTPSVMAMVDHLLVLAPGGRLAWFGPPDEGSEYFGVASPDEIFGKLPDKPPEEWGRAYRHGAAFRKFVRTREHLLGIDGVSVDKKARRVLARRSRWLQFRTLAARYSLTKWRDRTGMLVLLAQAPILATAMKIVFPEPDPATMFMLVLSALWFGASGSVRELIADRTIWRREARVGVSTLPYVASKVWVLGRLVVVQCTLLAGMNWLLLHMYSRSYSLLELVGVTSMTGLVGMALGLWMSSLFTSSEAAVGTLPVLLIPQITFGGLIVKVKEMSAIAKLVSYAMITRYAFEAAIKTGEKLSKPGEYGRARSDLPIDGALYDLGFRTSGTEDHGIPLGVLVGILFAFFCVFLLLASVRTRRTVEAT
jgi:ABC-type multidrug transport system ATPase subunit